eukprot:5103392-Ditylum_brightwellii.AAC.1
MRGNGSFVNNKPPAFIITSFMCEQTFPSWRSKFELRAFGEFSDGMMTEKNLCWIVEKVCRRLLRANIEEIAVKQKRLWPGSWHDDKQEFVLDSRECEP